MDDPPAICDFSFRNFVTTAGSITRTGHCLPGRNAALWRGFECPRLWQLQIGVGMTEFLRRGWRQEDGQDVAEYAVMLAVILAIAIGTIRLIGSHAGSVFANVGSAIQ